MKGITSITKGRVALTIPQDTPSDEVWRYGLGFPFQVGPKKAALFCNIRVEGKGSIDFENGTDVILFDTLSDIRPDEAIPLSRNKMGASSVTVKFPVGGGFVPFGAKQPDGSPHPHAGTGFGLCIEILYSLDRTGHFDYRDGIREHFELFQFASNGKDFRVLKKERVKCETLLSNCHLSGIFISNAIPDGKDLLQVMTAKTGEDSVSGVTRWRYGADGWRPISFVPVTEWSEPSLIRDVDGSLLFSARSNGKALFDAAVWRSADNGETWEQIIYRKECRSRSPVSLNRAVDGTPYIAANVPPHDRTREVLCYWPLNESRTDLEECRIARDAPAEFGPAPSGSWWRVDHPNSAIVQLADGAWHSILVYRISDNGEIEGDADPTPQTGCYVEEVLSRGEAIPAWNF
ncbi:MAG: exo-alpha-sialidase [Candidatus Latescibacteria bacterium]|nr:exo-alpha-sialidase [Candidatus Latescibacterota bacterium]